MPAECSYCGERKLCRKEGMDPLGLGKNIEWVGVKLISYNWICEECDKANTIIRNEERLEKLKQQKQNQLNWIKERDKLLKRNDK